MAFNTNEFRRNMSFGGARANHFDALITFPDFVGNAIIANQIGKFRCKSAQVPTITNGQVAVPYFGRTTKFTGDPEFEDFTATFAEDEDFSLRNAFEQWSNGINYMDFDTASGRPIFNVFESDLTSDITIRQFTKGGAIVKQWQLRNAWPSSVGAISYAHESSNTIIEFDVTITYDYMVTLGPDAIGSIGEGVFSSGAVTPG